jgi:hypothetical protein
MQARRRAVSRSRTATTSAVAARIQRRAAHRSGASTRPPRIPTPSPSCPTIPASRPTPASQRPGMARPQQPEQLHRDVHYLLRRQGLRRLQDHRAHRGACQPAPGRHRDRRVREGTADLSVAASPIRWGEGPERLSPRWLLVRAGSVWHWEPLVLGGHEWSRSVRNNPSSQRTHADDHRTWSGRTAGSNLTSRSGVLGRVGP